MSEFYFFDKNTQLLYYKDKVEVFTKKEYALLRLLIKNLNHPVDSEQIGKYIWEGEYVATSTIRSLIKRLKSRLHEDLIKNIHGMGYAINQVQ